MHGLVGRGGSRSRSTARRAGPAGGRRPGSGSPWRRRRRRSARPRRPPRTPCRPAARARRSALPGGVFRRLLRHQGEVAFDLALGGPSAQRQFAALGLQCRDLAQMGGALPLERDQLRLDAEQLLGLGAHLGVGDVVLGTERPVLRQRLLGELLALALQGLLLGQRPSSRCIASIRRSSAARRAASSSDCWADVPRRLCCLAVRLDSTAVWVSPERLDWPTSRTNRVSPCRTGWPRGRGLRRRSRSAERRGG